ncbi:probable tRNA methyltransferase 9B [Diaphorina citri]|uniref:Probable tRNA methyltransferase 9B n=1 Tax=Diaphorina citri TaxID=121845 RepID=A0A3Q0J081_DIACI|nr:probable tRNA methyltransferase 9B [Diaphorina citri]
MCAQASTCFSALKYNTVNKGLLPLEIQIYATGYKILLCDNLNLPFRDESFDAVLSIAVIHHFTTTERRVVALQELTRVLRIGGRIIISVWAMEQKNRKFKSQDVLEPVISLGITIGAVLDPLQFP